MINEPATFGTAAGNATAFIRRLLRNSRARSNTWLPGLSKISQDILSPFN
jgi:hypothetical protein